MSWKNICTPKSPGGLGIRRLDHLNECLAKLGWRVLMEKDNWWVQIVRKMWKMYLRHEQL